MNTSSAVGTKVAKQIVEKVLTDQKIGDIIREIRSTDSQLGRISIARSLQTFANPLSTDTPGTKLSKLIGNLLDEVIPKANVYLSEYGHRRELVDEVRAGLKTNFKKMSGIKNWSGVDRWTFDSVLDNRLGSVSASERQQPLPQYPAARPSRPLDYTCYTVAAVHTPDSIPFPEDIPV
jgi:hypothetical protein